jgi:hypothetical protein
MPSYNNPNDVLDLAQRIYMKRPNLGDMNTDRLLLEISNLANQFLSQPELGIQGIDDITKARALNRLLGQPSLSKRNPMVNELGVKMYQDLNDYGNYDPEVDPYFDPNKYIYDADIIETPYIPSSALYENFTTSNDFPPIETRTIRPHLNTALGRWYLDKGGIK